ncbi:hypothetical protein [Altererythrobacter sp.]|uniref:hypothetical protein n=1 Tax=Altererythrobacter sp. TaxID=1872480 RepID=UPI003D01DBF5
MTILINALAVPGLVSLALMFQADTSIDPAVSSKSPQSATSDSQQTDSTTDQLTVEAKKPKKVCHMETPTGSNFPRRVCRTVSSDSDDIQGMGTLSDLRRAREAQQGTQHGANPR